MDISEKKLLMEGDPKTLAKSISLADSDDEAKYGLLKNLTTNPNTQTIGITGPPGAGKSTLTAALVETILSKEPHAHIAILAVDPSSPFSEGALLGDRVRMRDLFMDDRIYIRSLASKGSLGGLNPNTLEVLYILQSANFDYVIIETVGVGQSEVEIAGLAETTILVLVPEAGDDIQIMKAGVLEIADMIVVNKADRPQADLMISHLHHALHHRNIAIIKTIASKGEGIEAVYFEIKRISGNTDHRKKAQLLTKYVLKTLEKIRTQDIDQQKIYKEILENLNSDNPLNIFLLSEKYL